MMLRVRDLQVRFDTPEGEIAAVNGIGFDVAAGESLAIVGESGSGKSQIAYACMGLLARQGRASGSVLWQGREILNAPEADLNRIRAREIAMVFQDPMTSLNPYIPVGRQLAEVQELHQGVSRRAALAEAARMLDAVQIPDARLRLRQFPHEMSGGMRQRVMIAMALMGRPKLLLADEPTTALDVTVQAQILALLREVRDAFGMALILITHDLGVVASAADRMIVLYGGQIMEQGTCQALFADPRHPYTRGLLQAVPRLDRVDPILSAIPGDPPDAVCTPVGCPFAPRCTLASQRCHEDRPVLTGGARAQACHHEGVP